jgi:DNA-binding transcriptional LysR family regulator
MMRDFLQMKSGRLVLAAIPSVSAYFMPQLITRFRQAHPGLELRLKEGTSSQIAGWVENGHDELGILQLPVAGAAFEVQTLFEESFLVVLPSGHRLARQKKIRLEQLAEEAFVEYKGRARSVVHTACLEAGFEPQIACECGDLDTIRNLVGAGLGVAVLPAMGHSRPHEGTLVVPLREPLTRQVALLQRLKHPLSPGAEVMKNLITTRARKR